MVILLILTTFYLDYVLILLLWGELKFVTRSWGLIPTRQVVKKVDISKTLYKEILKD